jgi:hypothetical protein
LNGSTNAGTRPNKVRVAGKPEAIRGIWKKSRTTSLMCASQAEAKKAVSDADFIPKPKIVKTGTDGD